MCTALSIELQQLEKSTNKLGEIAINSYKLDHFVHFFSFTPNTMAKFKTLDEWNKTLKEIDDDDGDQEALSESIRRGAKISSEISGISGEGGGGLIPPKEEATKLTEQLQQTISSLSIEEAKEAVRQAELKMKELKSMSSSSSSSSSAGSNKANNNKSTNTNEKSKKPNNTAGQNNKSTTKPVAVASSSSNNSSSGKSQLSATTGVGGVGRSTLGSTNAKSAASLSEMEKIQKEMKDMMDMLAQVITKYHSSISMSLIFV
jgi:Tfp pilus assembly protein PilX